MVNKKRAKGDPAGQPRKAAILIVREAPPFEEAPVARAGSLARFSGRGAGAAIKTYQIYQKAPELKIAFTADCHLTTRAQHPERYEALEDLLSQLVHLQIKTLVIAGDLFDGSSQNYAEFDSLCTSPEWQGIKFIVVPGNHDDNLKPQHFTADNVRILTEPTIEAFDSSGLKILLLPYRAEKTMGEFIAAKSGDLIENSWVLVGHGDWIEHFSERNPREPGVYMPLTQADIESYKPYKVILGHIHKPMDQALAHYVGSPCGLDIRETGRRRFLILDTKTGAISAQPIDTNFLYFNESLLILPVEKQDSYVREKLSGMIRGWELSDSEIPKVRIQLRVRGYSTNKQALLSTINDCLRGYKFYQDAGPDLSGVYTAEDPNRAEIANQVVGWIDQLEVKSEQEHPSKDQILLEALHVLYGE